MLRRGRAWPGLKPACWSPEAEPISPGGDVL